MTRNGQPELSVKNDEIASIGESSPRDIATESIADTSWPPVARKEAPALSSIIRLSASIVEPYLKAVEAELIQPWRF